LTNPPQVEDFIVAETDDVTQEKVIEDSKPACEVLDHSPAQDFEEMTEVPERNPPKTIDTDERKEDTYAHWRTWKEIEQTPKNVAMDKEAASSSKANFSENSNTPRAGASQAVISDPKANKLKKPQGHDDDDDDGGLFDSSELEHFSDSAVLQDVESSSRISYSQEHASKKNSDDSDNDSFYEKPLKRYFIAYDMTNMGFSFNLF